MKRKYWIKLHHAILKDPKMGQLSDRVWRRAIELFLLAGEHHRAGLLPNEEQITERLHTPVTELRKDLAALEDAAITRRYGEQWAVIGFARRQAPSGRALLRKARKSWYQDYLKTEHWNETKMRLFDARGFACEQCESECDLQVHHLSYENLGAEKNEDLMILCGDCHRIVHGMSGEDDADLAQATR